MENEIIIVENKDDLFLHMRELAFAQLNASYVLGLDAPPEDKEEFVKNFPFDEIDQEEFEMVMPTKVFEQYFEMHKEKEDVEGFPAIRQLGLMEAVNKLIYYGLMKTYSQLHDKGLVDMYCMPDGNISFVPKGQKPRFSADIVPAIEPEDPGVARVKIVRGKTPKKSKKSVPKITAPKKPVKKVSKTKKPIRKKKKNDDV